MLPRTLHTELNNSNTAPSGTNSSYAAQSKPPVRCKHTAVAQDDTVHKLTYLCSLRRDVYAHSTQSLLRLFSPTPCALEMFYSGVAPV